jgi:hypothetical protein
LPRVTLYAEFLPMKARAKCILLIEVRRRVAGSLENAAWQVRFSGVLRHRTSKGDFKKNIMQSLKWIVILNSDTAVI